MGRLATDNTSEDDDGIKSVVLGHLLCAVNQLKAARHGLYVDVLGQCAILLQGGHRTIEQRVGYLLVPFSHYYAEAHVAGVGHIGYILVGEVVECCSHDYFSSRRWMYLSISWL